MRDRRLESTLRRGVDRREFLAGGLTAVIAASARSAAGFVRQRPTFPTSPFTLGVASGDPTPGGVVLWTRLAPAPLAGGGMPAENVAVSWRVSRNEQMTDIVRRGTEVATPLLGHTIHVEVDGLQPDRWYWYQFGVGSEDSPVGRTRTLPRAEAQVDRLRFAFASCQHYEQGYYTAYDHMTGEDLDLVFHLGDYIYEYEGRDNRVRKHVGEEIELIEDYRTRYAQYRSDPDLQAAHAAFPWVVTWDDHEVDNNYADRTSEDALPSELFLRRRTEAYHAYYEHMPLRRSSLPAGPRMQLYRQFGYGSLASFFVLDTRQYRTDQPCGDRTQLPCPGMHDPDATLLGHEQERWLFDGLDQSSTGWNVIPQQVMMARVDRRPGPDERYSMDQWSGYDVARRRVMDFLQDRRPSNPVVLTGDIHSNWVNDLTVDGTDEAPVVGTELVTTSISSGGDGYDVRDDTAALLAENPEVKFFNSQRGYVHCAVTPHQLEASYRVLDYVTRRGSPMSTRARFVVDDGRPGAQRA